MFLIIQGCPRCCFWFTSRLVQWNINDINTILLSRNKNIEIMYMSRMFFFNAIVLLDLTLYFLAFTVIYISRKCRYWFYCRVLLHCSIAGPPPNLLLHLNALGRGCDDLCIICVWHWVDLSMELSSALLNDSPFWRLQCKPSHVSPAVEFPPGGLAVLPGPWVYSDLDSCATNHWQTTYVLRCKGKALLFFLQHFNHQRSCTIIHVHRKARTQHGIPPQKSDPCGCHICHVRL
jgi:hypothetical protein